MLQQRLNMLFFTGDLWSHYHCFYSSAVEGRKPSASLYCSSSIARHVDCLDEIFEARAWVWRTVSYWLSASTQRSCHYGNKGAGCSQSIARDQFQIKPTVWHTILSCFWQLGGGKMNILLTWVKMAAHSYSVWRWTEIRSDLDGRRETVFCHLMVK